ncbi:MAG: class I SAM-dependent methyltransferase, partial [Clostridia bacterium]|nr:class I SAM-dependent methyltransferase [Clostridia bacterium]
AAKAGAKKVVACDISQTALKTVIENASLNGFTNIETKCGDVFEVLREYRKEGKTFDVVLLDPPAFTKTSDKVKEAIKGYKDINVNGMKIVKKGGYLITCSCSHYLTVPLFLDMIKSAAKDAGRNAQLIEFRMQSRDHPTLLGMDESLYLKCAVLQID